MADYIRREDARRMVVQLDKYAWKSPVSDERRVTVDVDLVKFGLDRIPAADVAEVVHGRWILHHTVTGNPYTECSNCCTNVAVKTDKGTSAKLDMRGMPYCPFCSAKMDGGFDDATS